MKKPACSINDQPYTIYSDGSKEWYKDGLVHRDNGPAFVSADGWAEWRIEGRLHREDGPAVMKNGQAVAWALNGQRYHSTAEYQQAVGLSDIEMAALVLMYGVVA